MEILPFLIRWGIWVLASIALAIACIVAGSLLLRLVVGIRAFHAAPLPSLRPRRFELFGQVIEMATGSEERTDRQLVEHERRIAALEQHALGEPMEEGYGDDRSEPGAG